MMNRPPICPETIHLAANGRFMYFDIDVTDRLFWWNCLDCGDAYQETLAVVTAALDAGRPRCPGCKFEDGLCAASGCWDAADLAVDCDCGAHTHVCYKHSDLAMAS
ncbi:hypothetical protein E8D34_15950 [Nocardioides sp. GY 10113]|uniref:hypothetical protein n=1 Tax=Nocardioides sp. GY 10113 TaxID=2569761 RepID=UPI0010A75576|nr:hypothetical protein [Nocardioides sp. GY 10113]TIC83615.1 hypothetical protein E8D34_15950 [Nocardioides sp. GY 10113]